jgi:putative ABC transport system permease protein
MTVIWDDVRYAIRTLSKRKSFAAAALVTLALGIGANTAIFSVVQGVLLRPLPYPDSDRLVRISEEHPGGVSPLSMPVLSNLTINAWRPALQSLEGMAAFADAEFSVPGPDGTERIAGASVSPSLFAILRTVPAAGRLLQPTDEIEGAEPVVVLSDALWHERFGRDPAAIGRTLTLNNEVHTIIGVAQPSFYFPDKRARMWVVARASAATASAQVHRVIGRLAHGSTAAQAAAEGTNAARSVERPFVADMLFGKGGPVEVRVRGLVEEMTSRIRPALLVLAGAVGFVLLIGCANVANLCLSHGVARRRELAMRVALGASRGRILRQLLTETLVLSSVGGFAGLLLGWALIRLLPTLAPARFPRLDDVRMDLQTLAFAVGASVLAGVVSGLLPAIRGARASLTSAMNDGARSSSSSIRTTRVRAALIIFESALAVMLLVGAGLLVRSFVTLVRVDGGYEAANVLTARIYLPGAERGRAGTLNDDFVSRLLPRVRAWHEVVAAGAGNMSPFGQNTTMSGFELRRGDGQPVKVSSTIYIVTPGYAEALGLRLREGRWFEERDLAAPVQPVIVSEQFVRRYLNDGQPIVGWQFPALDSRPGAPAELRAEIVGVVGNVLKDGLDTAPQSDMYLLPTNDNSIRREIHLVVKTAGDPSAIVGMLRALVAEIEPTAAISTVGALASQVSASVGQPRFAATVLGAVAVLGLLLSAIGLYGVLSYNVSERRREMGVRAALGASRQQLLSMVIRQGLGVTLIGLALGLTGAALLGNVLQGVLFGVQPHDPIAFAVTPIVLLLVAFAACFVPASRAASVDPAEALRAE